MFMWNWCVCVFGCICRINVGIGMYMWDLCVGADVHAELVCRRRCVCGISVWVYVCVHRVSI